MSNRCRIPDPFKTVTRHSAEPSPVRGKTFLEVARTGPLSVMWRLATMLGDIE